MINETEEIIFLTDVNDGDIDNGELTNVKDGKGVGGDIDNGQLDMVINPMV